MTYLRDHALSGRLAALLRGAHDDDEPELSVLHDPPALVVRRADGSELSHAEEVEVRALLAADDVEALA
jgi:hypothetical protein